MVTLANQDIIVVILFFSVILAVGFYAGKRDKKSSEDYILSGRKLGLFLFVLTNVATWYGGILGVGEFTYRYGIFSWVTQGLPYYLFAILFALFFAEKIRSASLFTIPEKILEKFGKKPALFAGILIFILVSPAPYLLMIGNLISLIFNTNLAVSLIIGLLLSSLYLFKGGYSADIFTDAVEFFVMFAGFIVIVATAYFTLGGVDYLTVNLPVTHLDPTGGESPFYMLVWFLIALWTFADPGFHQRCYAAKSGKVAKWGLIISVLFWALFDFLTTTTGLYSRVANPEMANPVLSFPLLAEKILGPGLKGLFYAALFATIMSTLNSFLFLSGVTFGRDIIKTNRDKNSDSVSNNYVKIGIVIASIISLLLSLYFTSVIEIWYVFGSICIPGLIYPIFGSYFPAFALRKKYVIYQMFTAVLLGIIWYVFREMLPAESWIYSIEPMIIGMLGGASFYIWGKEIRPKQD